MNPAASLPGQSNEALDDRAQVQYEKRGRVAYIVLDRPQTLNAMDERTHEELGCVWDDFEQDDRIWHG